MEKMKDWIVNWIYSVLTGFDDNINNISNILTTDIFSGNLYRFATDVTSIVKPIALTIIGICFLIEFLRLTATLDILKWEYFAKVMFKLILAKVCIDVSFDLMSAIYATASEWITKVGNIGGYSLQSTMGGTMKDKLTEAFQGMGNLESLGMLSSTGFAFIAIQFAGLLVKVIAYARKIELLIYIAISPVPCSFLLLENGGGSQITKKFFLNFAAVSLQGLFIIISIQMYGVIVNELVGSMGDDSATTIAGTMLLSSIILVLTVLKSGSWAKAIFNVG